jgi:hypothetical protein
VKDVGTYTLTITGIGSYTGQQTASFKVVQTLSGAGTSGDPYIIADAKDWYVFGKYIKEDGYNNKYYKLANDFDNSNEPITEMIATDSNYPFCGTLDGNGRTLHIAIKANSEDGCAPFRYLKGATIQNLTVAGYAATSAKFGASIAVDNLNDGANITYITDCYSRVNIASSVTGDGTNGGFVGVNHGRLIFTRCAFLGRMLGTKATSNGGFVGWNDNGANLTITQCIFDPIRISMYDDTYSKTFSRYYNTNTPSLDLQSYFTYAEWGKDQGKQAVALTTPPANLGSKGETHGKMTLYQNGLECDGKYYVPNLGLYDNASNATLLSQADGKQLTVTLSGRTLFKDGNWNTLCLPFNLSSAEVGDNLGTSSDGIQLMELDTNNTSFDPATGTLRLYFKEATEIKAGTPYIIKWPSGTNIENHVFQSVKIDLSDEALKRQTVVSADENVQFIGTYSPVAIYSANHDNLFLGTDNKLHWPSTDGYAIKSCRAYFHVDGGSANAIELHFGGDDETTGIINYQLSIVNSSEADAWYTLDGRKIANGQKPKAKGIYIYKGKKQVIK